MACTSPSLTTVESYEDITSARTTGAEEHENEKPSYRRRHSSFHPRRKSTEMEGEESLLLRVCPLLPIQKNKENVADEVRWIFSSPNSSED